MNDSEVIKIVEGAGWKFQAPSGNPNRDHWLAPDGRRVYNFQEVREPAAFLTRKTPDTDHDYPEVE